MKHFTEDEIKAIKKEQRAQSAPDWRILALILLLALPALMPVKVVAVVAAAVFLALLAAILLIGDYR